MIIRKYIYIFWAQVAYYENPGILMVVQTIEDVRGRFHFQGFALLWLSWISCVLGAKLLCVWTMLCFTQSLTRSPHRNFYKIQNIYLRARQFFNLPIFAKRFIVLRCYIRSSYFSVFLATYLFVFDLSIALLLSSNMLWYPVSGG